ncbi:MAG TPA: hypothetical protein DD412_02670, partial [Holosporales bacterium]|nr:hypothetical protein [Holosporales bacterium]
PYFIKYNPTLRAEFGSQNAVLLFDRLEYWFSKTKNEFYKFIEPCEHPCYREGDSWCEELGFSRPVFRNAFDKIGMRYISKTAFEKESNPFKGKLFAYYQDRKSNKTIFIRNNSLLAELYERLKDIVQKAAKAIKPTVKKTRKIFQPRDDGLIQPYVRATKDKQINISFKKEDDLKDQENGGDGEALAQKGQIALDMKAIWVEEIGSRGLITFSPDVVAKVVGALEANFQGSLDLWQAHCLKIASSKFLMGEKTGTNFDIKFLYAISSKFISQLAEGKYELGTRKTSQDLKIEALSAKTKHVALKKDILDQHLSRLEDEKKAAEKRVISEKINSLSPKDLEGYKAQYEGLMKDSSSGEAHSFRQEGWGGRNVTFMFDLFLHKKMKETLFEKGEGSSSLGEQEKQLKEKRGHIQNLYDLGIKALKELKAGKVSPFGENHGILPSNHTGLCQA